MVLNQQNSHSSDTWLAATKESSTEASTSLSQPEPIQNPVTGECLTVLCSTRDSDGERLLLCFDLPPKTKGAPLHYHLTITETFEVLNGELEMELSEKRNRKTLRPGEVIPVPPGMHHSFWNASDEWVTFTTLVQPAAEFEKFIRGMYSMARDGVSANFLQFALLVEKSDSILVNKPLFVQKLISGVLTPIAYLLRVEQSLSKYWSEVDRTEA
ncbi:hypothetical protein BZZ01_10320 [Nostocales cyanobacterium HT-58-2]|nr:hypothetical protein BZZ01_10320 [Nostocales cyanobacterium HT-58-2]